MTGSVQSILCDGGLRLATFSELVHQPPLFASSASLWEDPYIATQMLQAHLDPATDAASRRPETIDTEVTWLVSRLALRRGDRVLDLGCGPGLYCTRLARRGLVVTGIDFSRNSLDHARAAAEEEGLPISYRLQDYDTLQDCDLYQAALLIYGDFGVLPDEPRNTVLDGVYRALRPGGYFAFDVLTPAAFPEERPESRWEVREGGFWHPSRHLLLERQFLYAQDLVSLRQYSILSEHGDLTTYRVWTRYYSPQTLVPVLEDHGFQVEDIRGDPTGTPYCSTSNWLAVVARRPFVRRPE